MDANVSAKCAFGIKRNEKSNFVGTKSQADYYFGQTNGYGQFEYQQNMYGKYVCVCAKCAFVWTMANYIDDINGVK